MPDLINPNDASNPLDFPIAEDTAEHFFDSVYTPSFPIKSESKLFGNVGLLRFNTNIVAESPEEIELYFRGEKMNAAFYKVALSACFEVYIVLSSPLLEPGVLHVLQKPLKSRRFDIQEYSFFSAGIIGQEFDRLYKRYSYQDKVLGRCIQNQPLESGEQKFLPYKYQRTSSLLGFDNLGEITTFKQEEFFISQKIFVNFILTAENGGVLKIASLGEMKNINSITLGEDADYNLVTIEFQKPLPHHNYFAFCGAGQLQSTKMIERSLGSCKFKITQDLPQVGAPQNWTIWIMHL